MVSSMHAATITEDLGNMHAWSPPFLQDNPCMPCWAHVSHAISAALKSHPSSGHPIKYTKWKIPDNGTMLYVIDWM
jgi:hypothetical protein